MAKINSQNSEHEQKRTGSERIEKIVGEATKGEKGQRGEMLRPSEREPAYHPPADKVEGQRNVTRK